MRVEYTSTFERINSTAKKIVVVRGGTRAGKTYAIMQMLAIWLLTGVFRGEETDAKTVSIVRKTLPSLKATALRDLEEILTDWGVFHLIAQNKTDKLYTYEDRVLEFFSVDDQQKVRGRKRDILFCNEANELNFDTDFFQLLIRTKYYILLDLNPSDPYTWVKTEIEDKRAHEQGDVDTVIVNYKHNEFLTEGQKREIEAIKDPILRKVYVHGEYGQIKGVIFDKITIVDSFPEYCKKVAVGLDFGYTNDPTAVVRCGILGDNLYIDELLYEYALTNQDIAKRLPKDLDAYCDSAEPKSIEELKRAGIKAYPAAKGRDSVLFGINTIKNYNICITANSYNLLKEQKLYKYKTDSNGQPSNQPIDDFNHAWDAVRYYALIQLTKPKKGIWLTK